MAIPPFSSPPTLDATASIKGKVQLTGDLGGTASAPTVTDLTITSEAQGDVLYRNASNWVRLPAGTPGHYLQTQGAAANPQWAAVSGSGQILYQCTVATSGGDYTTLGAAVTAGMKRIFVRDGTYTETGNITLTSGTIVVGESLNAVINLASSYSISMGTNAKIEIKHLGIQNPGSNGMIRMGGARQVVDDVYFDHGTTTSPAIVMGDAVGFAQYARISRCFFDRSSSTNTTANLISVSATNSASDIQVTDCYAIGRFSTFFNAGSGANGTILIANNYVTNASGGTATGAILFHETAFNGSSTLITGNYCTSLITQAMVDAACTAVNVVGNTFNQASAGTGVRISGGGARVVGNSIISGATGINLGGSVGAAIGNSITASTTGINITAAAQNITGNTITGATTPIANSSNVSLIANNYGVPVTRSVSANTTQLSFDSCILVDATGASRTTTLLSAANVNINTELTIKKTDASVNTVTIDGAGSETIDGATTYVLGAQWKYVTIRTDGTSWFIVANN